MAELHRGRPLIQSAVEERVQTSYAQVGIYMIHIKFGCIGSCLKMLLFCCRVPEECPQYVADLIEACQQRDPNDRPSSQEVYDQLKAGGSTP